MTDMGTVPSYLEAALAIGYEAFQKFMPGSQVVSVPSQVGQPDAQSFRDECEFDVHDLARVVCSGIRTIFEVSPCIVKRRCPL